MSALAGRLALRGRRLPVGLPAGISAIIVKELRGRMRLMVFTRVADEYGCNHDLASFWHLVPRRIAY